MRMPPLVNLKGVALGRLCATGRVAVSSKVIRAKHSKLVQRSCCLRVESKDKSLVDGESESELVRRIIAGDRQAEEELVHRYSRCVRMIIKTRVRNSADVEDLVQETFVTVLVKIRNGEVRKPEKLSGFILGIARYKSLEHIRPPAQKNKHIEIDQVTSLIHPDPNPFDHLSQKEEAELVQQVIDKLSEERDQQILLRFNIAGEEKKQFCYEWGLTEAHFNRVKSRALKRFKKLYEESVSSLLRESDIKDAPGLIDKLRAARDALPR